MRKKFYPRQKFDILQLGVANIHNIHQDDHQYPLIFTDSIESPRFLILDIKLDLPNIYSVLSFDRISLLELYFCSNFNPVLISLLSHLQGVLSLFCHKLPRLVIVYYMSGQITNSALIKLVFKSHMFA